MLRLPELKQYRAQYLCKNTVLPLKIINVQQKGLLEELPKVTSKKGWPWDIQVETRVYNEREDWPKLTIVTPSFNQANFIEETIRSVLLQNYPNLEFIIIDGGSADGTLEILQKYSKWISFYESVKDEGQGQAINKGFSLASGDYYAWINSDDYYLSETFLKVILTFIKKKTEFVYGYSIVVAGSNLELIRTLPLLDFLIRMPTLQQPACFWSSKIHKPIWEDLMCSLDYELWIRLVKGKKRKLLRVPLAAANAHIAAKTHNPGMGYGWKRDHELICDEKAHGVVKNWYLVYLVHRVWVKINKYYNKIW